MKTPQFLQIYQENSGAIRQELLDGLSADLRLGGAMTSPKFLYDALGSRLFEAITELPEYYPTRTEAAIFAEHGAAMAQRMAPGSTLIDLGAGNCAKAARLFGLLSPQRYVAVDISVNFLRDALACLQRQYPALDMVGLGLDFSSGLALPPEVGDPSTAPRLLFYPGSSIGNFSPPQALSFLRSVHAACGPLPESGLLIGVDLLKDTAELEAAYDDALGVTAAFNRNLLLHINRLAGTDFELAHWQHVGRFDTALSRIEMHLQATRDVTVRWPGGHRKFAAGERIHTENSYKWTQAGFEQLLSQAGFGAATAWTDPDKRFAVYWVTL
jgi:dimethylhistidine N-methyltransferase